MDDVQAQYEAYPYPERDPADEKKRLIIGSPSFPQEMDHWLWGGSRDWSKPLKVLIAGGGTGDALIQLAQRMTDAGRPYDITYVDLSKASRAVAEKRAAVRGLKSIKFVTESLLNARDFGEFDYIDCCGVLHHLSDPQAGFQALSNALAPGGGIGLMVYAPLGRSGVYPLQNAFGMLSKSLKPKEKLELAKQVYAQIPKGHPFKSNPHLVDHKTSDAGFYDLLLHSSDRPFRISELVKSLDNVGLELSGLSEPASYDPSDLVNAQHLSNLSEVEKMQLAEDLRGTLKVHVAYAVPKGERQKPPLGRAQAIPHLREIDPRQLAQTLAKKGKLRLTSGGQTRDILVPKSSAVLVAGIDGRRSLAALRTGAKLDPIEFAAAWSPIEKALVNHGLLHYSTLLHRR